MKLRSIVMLLFSQLLFASPTFAEDLPEIRIVSSSEEMVKIYKNSDYWGELEPEKIIEVPPLLVVATTPEWRRQAAALTVEYAFACEIAPLLHQNVSH